MVNRVEDAIQAALIDWVHNTYNDIKITATRNEKSYRETNQIGDIGITDLLLFLKRNDILYVLFLELKTKDGKLIESQIEWNTDFDLRFLSRNSSRGVAYGFIEAKEIISDWHHQIS